MLQDFYKEIIEDELNVKAVEFTDDVRNFTTYTFKPQLKTVGPKYGKQLGEIRNILTNLDGNVAMDELETSGALRYNIGDVEVVLTKEDLLIEMTQMEGYVSENNNNLTVVLDTNLTDELIEEGFVREIISKVQTMRKEAGFEVMDKITIYISNNAKITEIVENNKSEIMSVLLADNIVCGDALGYSKPWNINGEDVVLGVEKL